MPRRFDNQQLDFHDLRFIGIVSSRRIYSMNFMSSALMDGKLLAFYCLETFANNFLSINAKDMK